MLKYLRSFPKGHLLIICVSLGLTLSLPIICMGWAFVNTPPEELESIQETPQAPQSYRASVRTNSTANTVNPLDSLEGLSLKDILGLVVFGALILMCCFALYAGSMIQEAYIQWSQVPNTKRIKGREVATLLLSTIDTSIAIEPVRGRMTDHYDPKARVVRLSADVMDRNSILSLAVAAHEIGHVEQHFDKSWWLEVHDVVAPITPFLPIIAFVLIVVGIFLKLQMFITLLVIMSASTFVAYLTVPCEVDATKRGIRMLQAHGLIGNQDELQAVKIMLGSATWTYIAGSFEVVRRMMRIPSPQSGKIR